MPSRLHLSPRVTTRTKGREWRSVPSNQPFRKRPRFSRPVVVRMTFCFRNSEIGRDQKCRQISAAFSPPNRQICARCGWQKGIHIHRMALQFGIGEIGDQGLLANGTHGYDIAPAVVLWHGMVPDNGLASWTAAKPIRRYLRRRSSSSRCRSS
jgi:hypothetical protein